MSSVAIHLEDLFCFDRVVFFTAALRDVGLGDDFSVEDFAFAGDEDFVLGDEDFAFSDEDFAFGDEDFVFALFDRGAIDSCDLFVRTSVAGAR